MDDLKRDVNDKLILIYEALVKGASFQTLIDLIRRIFENPVYVSNCNLETVGHSIPISVGGTSKTFGRNGPKLSGKTASVVTGSSG